jgi:hypothetical protein
MKKVHIYADSVLLVRVTSISTPLGSLTSATSFTTLGVLYMSITRLCTLISNRSKVFVPLPQGDFLVVMRRVFVGMRTGPLTFSCFFFADLMIEEQTNTQKQSGIVDERSHTNLIEHNFSSPPNQKGDQSGGDKKKRLKAHSPPSRPVTSVLVKVIRIFLSASPVVGSTFFGTDIFEFQMNK